MAEMEAVVVGASEGEEIYMCFRRSWRETACRGGGREGGDVVSWMSLRLTIGVEAVVTRRSRGGEGGVVCVETIGVVESTGGAD